MARKGRTLTIDWRRRVDGSSTSDGRPPWTSQVMLRRGGVPGTRGSSWGRRLRLKDIWAIRVRLQIGRRTRELALFNLAIDSKLRSCDLVRLRVRDVCHGNVVASRTMVMQPKTQRPVQFEITEHTRVSLTAWIRSSRVGPEDYLFPSRLHSSPHLSARQYARIVRGWVREIGLCQRVWARTPCGERRRL